jgi:hypothetical protein
MTDYVNVSDNDDSERSDDDKIYAATAVLCCTRFRSPVYFRKRWDSHYLANLAIRERSFKREYRTEPREFDILYDLLSPRLEVNQEMARLAMSN